MHQTASPHPPVISVIIPMHNEQDNLDELFRRLTPVCEQIGEYEIICVNDGSRDQTMALLIHHHAQNQRIKAIDLSRNFGKEIALTAGIDHSSGQAVVPLDADLQDPPELIHELVAKWREGYTVVNATRLNRDGESYFKQLTARLFYRVFSSICDIDCPQNTGDFRLLDRTAVTALAGLHERTRFMKGLFAWVGFRQATVFYNRDPRFAGGTKWNYWQLWNFALDGITSFTALPLKVWTYAGLLVAFFSFLYASFLIVRVLAYGRDMPGYASIMVVMLFLGGIQLITLGVLGEYVGRIYNEVKQRPLYLVQRTLGIGD